MTGDCLIQWKCGSIACQDGDIACVQLQREPVVKAEGRGDAPWGCSMGIFHEDIPWGCPGCTHTTGAAKVGCTSCKFFRFAKFVFKYI